MYQRNTVEHIRLTVCISEVGGLFHVTEGIDWAILWNLNDQVFFLRYSMSKFTDFGMKEEILQAIANMGFSEPTKIQELAIPKILQGNDDIIALAQTGTGKTGAFGIPSIHKIDSSVKNPQVLVLSPTRELALQSAKELKKFAKYLDGVKSVAVYGGADVMTQRKAIKSGCQIIVGTLVEHWTL